jgi:hypothetical protein
MTRDSLNKRVRLVLFIYAFLACALFALRLFRADPNDPIYSGVRDAVGFLIAIPAAWLASEFQARNCNVERLRRLFSLMIESVRTAIQYTHLSSPSQSEYSVVMAKLSTVIDETRAVFKNVGERFDQTKDGAVYQRGVFPFEPLKQIH